MRALILLFRMVLVVGVLLGLLSVAGRVFALWLAFHLGRWTVRKVPVERAEQPSRFWFWTGVNVIALVGSVAAASVLLWAIAHIQISN